MTNRLRKAMILALAGSAVFAVLRFAEAQFISPTCTPPNCNPTVIQNIPAWNGAGSQNASFNITGSGRIYGSLSVGNVTNASGTMMVGSDAPTLSAAGQNLVYGNVNNVSTAGSLILLQKGGADRFRVDINGNTTITGGNLTLTAGTITGNGSGITNINATHATYLGPSNGVTANANGNVQIGGTTSVITDNIIYANNTSGPGSLLLLQSASLDRFRVDPSGNTTLTGGNLTLSSGTITGNGSGLTTLNASNLSSGTVASARLGSGTANSTTYLRGDGTWAAPTLIEADTLQSVTSRGNSTTTYIGVNGASAVSTYGLNAIGASAGVFGTTSSPAGAGGYFTTTVANSTALSVAGNVFAQGTGPYAPSSGVNLSHVKLTSNFTPTASSPNFAEVEINPNINGTSSGKGTALAVSVQTGTLTGGTVNLMDLGTTGSAGDYYTGFTSKFRVDAGGNLASSGSGAFTGTLTLGGVNVCLQNGTNCPAGAGVTSVSGSGAGISVSPTTGAVVVQNTGVTSAVAGSDVNVSGATGAVTINDVSTLQTVTNRGNATSQPVGVGGAGSNATIGLNASGSSYGVYGNSAGGSGTGVYGNGTLYGVQGNSASNYGGYFNGGNEGVYATSGNIGVYGTSSGGSFVGVNGSVNSGSSIAKGVLGSVSGTNGAAGVYGDSSISTVPGGYFKNSAGAGNYALGVEGYLNVTGVIAANGAAPSAGAGVSANGTNYAVYGSSSAIGSIALYGSSAGSSGLGVYGGSPYIGVNGCVNGYACWGWSAGGDFGGPTAVYAHGTTYSLYSDLGTLYNAGNVGIGITSPADTLHVNAATSNLLRLQSTTGGAGNTAGIDFVTYPGAGTSARIAAIDAGSWNGSLAFYTDNDNIQNTNLVERMRIYNTGDVDAPSNVWGASNGWYYCNMNNANGTWTYCTCASGSWVGSLAFWNPAGLGYSTQAATLCYKL